MEMRKQSRRAASKEALKQLQLMSNSSNDEDGTETYEITSDEEVITVEQPPKKKYRLSHRKSTDGNDRDVLVLKTVENKQQEPMKLEAWPEELTPVQKAMHDKIEKELKDMNARIEQMVKQTSAEMIYQSDVCGAFQVGGPPSLTYTGVQAPPQNVVLQRKSTASQPANYQLVMDPRLGLIVGTMTPTATVTQPQAVSAQVQTKPTATVQAKQQPKQTRGTRTRVTTATATGLQQKPAPPAQPIVVKTMKQKHFLSGMTPPSSTTIQVRPTESSSVGGLSTGRKGGNSVVDLTSGDGRTLADSREISFNKLQGKTFPSLVVVARPHLRVKEPSGGDRSKLDTKVKAVLMHVPTKFTEWLIQQGLVRSEQSCSLHPTSKLKLGMYSDVSKFPYSGGYVWISECCPTRFVSVFSGSLFEGSPHPPSVILKLIYHWACQTNVQNVVQWVKVDNLYVKGLNTWLRAVCTVALHTHVGMLGGPARTVEVGVISLGTTSQDGHQRQVKVEVLGLLEVESKLLRLRAVEPLAEGDRNYKRRFSKILEPIMQWVHPESTIMTDLTVDKATLHGMGFKNVHQSTAADHGVTGNQTIMEYLRRIVPRMFQNTLSLLSRQIIQQFLDELVWREWFGTTAVQAFDNMVIHLSEQTRCVTGQSLIMRLNKVAANPFKNWSISGALPSTSATHKTQTINTIEQVNLPITGPKRSYSRQKGRGSTHNAPSPEVVPRPTKPVSPDVPEQLVPLENYYYGIIRGGSPVTATTAKVNLNVKCCMCKSYFSNNILLMMHLFSHAHNAAGQSSVRQCRYCLANVSTSDGLERHIAQSHPSETRFKDGFVCQICEATFVTPLLLGKHMSKQHNPAELPYLCATCGFRCSSHRQAVDHFYTEHDGTAAIQCPFCLRSTNVFSNNRHLPQNVTFFMQHLQKHQKRAVAKKCNQCILWFVNKQVLVEHQSKMHDSQRHKEGLIPGTVPRNCIMVPKSKHDRRQPDVAGESMVNFSRLLINASTGLMCKECRKPLTEANHYQSFVGCTLKNCQYSTCCAEAYREHLTICRTLSTSLPTHPLPTEMYCVCGYSDKDGYTLAKHLAICEKKSAYPSKESAQGAINTHSMLDVLGLMRREEPTCSDKLIEDKATKAESCRGNDEKEVTPMDADKEEQLATKTEGEKDDDTGRGVVEIECEVNTAEVPVETDGKSDD